jgi:tetratricopeptide (TPR) repeat protein
MKKTILTLFFLLTLITNYSQSENKQIYNLLTFKAPPSPYNPKYSIYRQDDILFCRGESELAQQNNKGAILMQTGNYEDAIKVLTAALKRSPLFYPLLYNLGKSHAHQLNYNLAFLYLKKAQNIVPEYFLTYAEIGKTYESDNQLEEALDFYRKAAHLDEDYLDALILLGNVYVKMNRITTAKKYYDAALEKNPYFANGLLGKARLQFMDKDYYRAYNTLRIIDTENSDYDKAYHFFYAECAYNLQKYSEAFEQYEKLLEFSSDRFFLTTPISLIEHKKELSSRFYEQELLQEQLQGD